MKNKKSQASIEFLILIGIMTIISVLVLAVLGNYSDRTATAIEETIFKDYGNYLQSEIITASQVNDGYIRKITLPNSIHGYEYTISNTNKSFKIISERSNIEFFYDIPKISGTLKKGENIIRKKEGVINID